MAKRRKSEAVRRGETAARPVKLTERAKIASRILKRNERLRKMFPEVHGKVMDFIDQSIEDGTLYISIRFKDKTDFCLRYGCKLFFAGADFCNVETGDYKMIRKYFRPLPD